MLKRFLIVFIAILGFIGCNGPKKPKNLISKNKMVNILIDAKLVGSANAVNRKTLEDKGILPNTYIYNKYNIDSLQFAESNIYYTYQIKDYEEIYQMVNDSLEKLKEHYKNIQKEEQKKRVKKSEDSLSEVLKTRDSIKFPKGKNSAKPAPSIDDKTIQELENLDIEL